jgi:stage IV sporulation protein FB
MGWQDRSYYRDRSYGSGNRLIWLLNSSVSLGRWFGIDVRVHASLIVCIGLMILLPWSVGGIKNAATEVVLLFTIVLLHEFGHCFASRMVGGSPNQIMMTPLGGLAFADAPRRPWATFVTVLGGPLVNVLICLLVVLVVLAFGGGFVLPWRHRDFANAAAVLQSVNDSGWIARWVWWTFTTSYFLLLFNLMPIFPLDGGQLLQSLLWVKLGYYKATYFATITGMIGGAMLALYAFAPPLSIFLLLIAISGFMTCLNLYRELKANGPWAYEEEEIYSAAYENPDRPRKRSARKIRAVQRQERAVQQEQEQVDAILAKVHEKGMQSLSWLERRTLKRATERQRKRAGG